MSSISGTNQALYQFLQSFAVDTGAQKETPVGDTNTTTSADTELDTEQAVQDPQHRHHRGHGHGPLFEKLGEAVLSALQAAQQDPSTISDPNKIIEDTITKFLEDNNIPLPGRLVGHAPGTSAPDGDAGTDAVDQARPSRNPEVHAFFEALRTFGVDPQQFRHDFLAAIKNARHGDVAPSTAMKSFPPGSAVDTAS